MAIDNSYIKYLLIPYEHRGRSFTGADCFGFIRLFCKEEHGVNIADFTEDYPQEWWLRENYFITLHKEYGFTEVTFPQPGDIILFKNTTTRIGHCGVVLNDGMFIHMSIKGAAIASYISGQYQRQVHSIYRHKDLL